VGVKILIAEDDPVSRRMLQGMLAEWGHEAVAAADGGEAWRALQDDGAFRLAVLDWVMPVLDGIEVCRLVRRRPTPTPPYLILLTARDAKADIVAGLRSGANDYVTKPFDREELQARVQVGCRVVDLQQSLADRVRELEAALAQVKQLYGLLPICSYCKKIRDDQNYWQQVEAYLGAHSGAQFSHSICPECYEGVVKPKLLRWKDSR
jgi:DNA-binding response OmpR family regulator